MAGYNTPYGEDIRSLTQNFNKRYVEYYDDMESVPFSFQGLSQTSMSKNPTTYFSGAVMSRGTYSGEKVAPRDITQREAEKELEVQLNTPEGGRLGYKGGMLSSRAKRISMNPVKQETPKLSEFVSKAGLPSMAVSKLRQQQKKTLEMAQRAREKAIREAEERASEEKMKKMEEAREKWEETGGIPFLTDFDDYELTFDKFYRYYTNIKDESAEDKLKEKKYFITMLSEVFGIPYNTIENEVNSRLIKDAMKDKSLSSYPEVMEYMRNEELIKKRREQASKNVDEFIKEEKKKRTATKKAKEARIEAKRSKDIPRVKDLPPMSKIQEDARRLRELIGSTVEPLPAPVMKRGKESRANELKKYNQEVARVQRLRDKMELPALSEDEAMVREGLPSRADFMKYLENKYGRIGRGRPRKMLNKTQDIDKNPDVRLDDMKPVSGGVKKLGRPKKEKVGKVDPKIEKLLGGELIMKAQKGSSMSGGKRKISDKMKKRGELVKKIMKERGVKLSEASKIIKAEGLM